MNYLLAIWIEYNISITVVMSVALLSLWIKVWFVRIRGRLDVNAQAIADTNKALAKHEVHCKEWRDNQQKNHDKLESKIDKLNDKITEALARLEANH